MLIRKPDYYEDFTCIANNCPATCCAGWEIGIDSKTMNVYKNMTGVFANRLHNSIDEKRSCFLQYEDKCIFLNEERLCDIYKEAGEDYLCKTCKTYPRHIEVYPGVQEYSLAISCPEAARMILSNREKVIYLLEEKECILAKGEDTREVQLYNILCKARNVSLRFLQDRELPIRMRISIVIAMTHDLQRRLNEDDLDAVLKVLGKYQNSDVIKRLSEKITGYKGKICRRRDIVRKMHKTMMKLEVLNPQWRSKLVTMQHWLKKQKNEEYLRCYFEFVEQDDNKDYELLLEQLICYFVMNYYCTAVYDEAVYAKMKFSVFCTMFLSELNFFTWMIQGKQISFQDVVKNAYQFGREVEHLDQNLDYLDSEFIKKKAYCLEEFLILLS